jgi:hypothetical protein
MLAPRFGITLLEVMIAVMVLAIGLVGVGALVSVGALQAQRAGIDDRKAAIGQAEARDARARGFLHAEIWRTAAGAPFMPTVSGTQVFPADSMGNQNNLQPVAIDPLMIGALPSAANIGTFAQANAQLTMPRLTLNSTVSMAAQQACMLEDDKSFTISTTNADALPMGGYNAANTKREFVGQYTWLATLVPVYGDLQPTDASNLMYMSIVVFNKRQFSIPPASANPPTERACQVTAVAGSGFGGGDLTLSGGSANAVALRVGECLLLGWMQLDVPADPNSGKATTFSPAAKFGKAQRPMFRWYRILNAGPPTNSGGTWTRNITVAGTDLPGPMPGPMIAANSMYAFIYDGAVAVYERTVRLEGPSMWTN